MALVKITKDNFSEIKASEKVVLIDFYADWCGPCRMVAPIIEEIAGERDDIIVGKINVDGDKFKARLDLAYGSDENYVTYTFIDGTLYTEWREDGNTVRDSRPYSDEDKAALRDSFGEGANIGTEDFEEVELKSAGKVDRITCTKIKDAPLNALIASLEADLASFDADVAIKNATLDIEIDNGRYNVVVFTCEYFITTSTDSYSLTMTYSSKFNYTKELEIVTPIM